MALHLLLTLVVIDCHMLNYLNMKKLFRNTLLTFSGYIFFITETFSAGMNSSILSAEEVFNNVIVYLINPLLKLVIVITFLYFLYGMLRYIFAMSNGGKDEEINNGKRHMLWGLVGLFIIFSINGIMSLLSSATESTIGSIFGF